MHKLLAICEIRKCRRGKGRLVSEGQMACMLSSDTPCTEPLQLPASHHSQKFVVFERNFNIFFRRGSVVKCALVQVRRKNQTQEYKVGKS